MEGAAAGGIFMSTSTRTHTRKIRYMAYLSLLIALQIILTVVPQMGMIVIPGLPFSITIMHIPVLIGAVTLGIKAGAILGLCFGLGSLFVSTTRPAGPFSMMFSPFHTGNPLSLVMTLVPRILCGVIAALIFIAVYKAFKKSKASEFAATAAAAAAGSITNTALVLILFYVLFGQVFISLSPSVTTLEYLRAFLLGAAATNGVIELIAAVVICTALVKPLRRIVGEL